VPHVTRMAGSDAGRLWHHPQLEALYDHVLKSAETVIAVGTVAERAIERGVAADRITPGGYFAIPEQLFTPLGPRLDLNALRNAVAHDPDFRALMWGELVPDRPHFGVYGKLGERKGSFSLLGAMHRLKRSGRDTGLVVLAQGDPRIQERFRKEASELGLADRILQLPFIPHWRVAEFLRGCLAVCCLEQDFPIGIHSPIIPREVLMAGTCLVGSTEVIRKLPSYDRLPHGYGCIAIEDVDDIGVLSERLAAIADDPDTAAAIGRRGHRFAAEQQQDMQSPQTLERILAAAAARRRISRRPSESKEAEPDRFRLTSLAAASLAEAGGQGLDPRGSGDLAWAQRVLASIDRSILAGDASRQPLALAVRIEIAVAAAEEEADGADPQTLADPLFRLRLKRWALKDGELAELIPLRDAQLRIVEFDYDVSEFLGVASVADFPATVTPGRSYILVFGRSQQGRREPLLVDALTSSILRLSDGTRTAAEIADAMGSGSDASAEKTISWIENLFQLELLSLQESRAKTAVPHVS